MMRSMSNILRTFSMPTTVTLRSPSRPPRGVSLRAPVPTAITSSCARRALVISICASRACHSLNRVAQGLGEMSFTPRTMATMSASIGLAASGWSLSATAASSRSAISTSGLSAVEPAAWRPCSSNRCALNMVPLAAMLGSRTVGSTSASDARSTPAGRPRTLAWAKVQLTMPAGGRPGSEISSGPVNSPIRSFGS